MMRCRSFTLIPALALLALGATGANAAPVRLTDHAGAFCSIAAPSPSRDGALVAFESTCNLTGDNIDGNREIFQVDRSGLVTQLTSTTDCANANPSSDANGSRVAFDSDCDGGGNEDRNVEIFVTSAAAIIQVTDTSLCTSLAPSINANGGLVSFDSDCDLTGANLDHSVEIFRVIVGGTAQQLTDDRSVSGCASINASSDTPGTGVIFESDCDLAGSNADQVNEVFRSRTGNVIDQLTSSPGEPCANVTPVVASDGGSVVFSSDCDLLGENVDLSSEIYSVSTAAGVVQLTDDVGTSGCESFSPSAASADRVVFLGYCNPAGDNDDGNLEVFLTVNGLTTQLTESKSCWNSSPRIAANGESVVFVSSCNLTGTDGDGEADIYVDSVCACGAPLIGEGATATEALYALKAAIGVTRCALCECDVNSDERVSALDALLILNKAIGQPIDLVCS